MKLLLILLAASLCPTAFAQGAFLGEVTPQAETLPESAPIPRPAPERPKVVRKPPAAENKGPADGCTTNYNVAATYFKAVHGNDVELSRIGDFTGTFKDHVAQNKLKKSGDHLFLNMSLMNGWVNTDIPVTICKRGNRLTATLLTSHAREANTNYAHRRISRMVASGEAPQSISINITRSNRAITFYGKSGDTEIRATAGLR